MINDKLTVLKPERKSLTRQCVNNIQSYIKANQLCAGDRLPSFQEWAELLGVSVIIVREAFRSLEALGLVDIQHGRGIYLRAAEQVDFLDLLAFKHSLNEFKLKDIAEARAMLDLVVLEMNIVRAGQETIDTLEDLIQQMYSLYASGEDVSPAHNRFHQVMLEASGNNFLIDIGIPLLNTFWTLDAKGIIRLAEGYSVEEISYHAAYIDAIRERSLSNSRELVDRHLLGLCSKYSVFPLVS